MALEGSGQAPHGSFAEVLYEITSKTHWCCHTSIFKGHANPSSFCTKVCGYLRACSALHDQLQAFMSPTNIPPIPTNIQTDNLGVVQRSSNTPFSLQQCHHLYWDISNKTLQV